MLVSVPVLLPCTQPDSCTVRILGSRESSDFEDRTEETAVMIDCFSSLAISEVAKSGDPLYFKSWSQE